MESSNFLTEGMTKSLCMCALQRFTVVTILVMTKRVHMYL